MPSEIARQIPGNLPGGVIRNQFLDLSTLREPIVANELFECTLTGKASARYGELGPNLISCNLKDVAFNGIEHFDAKDSVFVDVLVTTKFDRIFITDCSFRGGLFKESTFSNTVIVDSHFDSVTFQDCDFSIATFKSNTFVSCKWLNCKTLHKVFEHCIFEHCQLSGIILQEGAILQNFGIRLSEASDLKVYRAGTAQEFLAWSDLQPKNRLERISYEFFVGANLNSSATLLEVVRFQLDDANLSNIFHLITGIRHLTTFLIFLYESNEIILFFLLQLYWSLDRLLRSHHSSEIPPIVLESMEISAAKLRPFHEEITAAIALSPQTSFLVADTQTKSSFQCLVDELGLDLTVSRFVPYNSPSLVQLASTDNVNLLLFTMVVVSTRVRLEIDRYKAGRKLLDFGTRLLTEKAGRGMSAAKANAFQALLCINLPHVLYARLTVTMSISMLNKLRKAIVDVLH